MNAKATLDTLNMLARQVFRTFYPENFIVVSELLRHTEFVQADVLAARLNLSEQTVNKSLNDLRQKRLVHSVKYGELPPFWAFDYHAFVNVVRYKVAILKQREADKSKAMAASGGVAAAYACLKCGREMSWAEFVRLANAGAEPQCPVRGCGGKLQKESKRAAEGLKPLEVIGKALQRLEGQEIPMLGRRAMNAKIEEAARREDEERPEGGPRYEMPVLGPGKTTYVVQLCDRAPSSQESVLPPPELRRSGSDEGNGRQRPAPPPWLQPTVLDEWDGGRTAAAAAASVAVAPRAASTSSSVSLAEAVRAYPSALLGQLESSGSAVDEDVEMADWDGEGRGVPVVRAAGVEIALDQLTEAHLLAMSPDEYRAYFDAHQSECATRLKQLFMS